jgi:hypothetical protein
MQQFDRMSVEVLLTALGGASLTTGFLGPALGAQRLFDHPSENGADQAESLTRVIIPVLVAPVVLTLRAGARLALRTLGGAGETDDRVRAALILVAGRQAQHARLAVHFSVGRAAEAVGPTSVAVASYPRAFMGFSRSPAKPWVVLSACSGGPPLDAERGEIQSIKGVYLAADSRGEEVVA